MTATPAWPPPIGAIVYIGAQCEHFSWGETRLTWDGKTHAYSLEYPCPDGCATTVTARWTQSIPATT